MKRHDLILTLTFVLVWMIQTSVVHAVETSWENELSSEYQECSVYYVVVVSFMQAEAKKPQPFAPTEQINAKVAQYMETANKYGKVALEVGEKVGLTNDAFATRQSMLTQKILQLFKGNFSNMGVLASRYEDFCRKLWNEPNLRMQEIQSGHVCDANYKCW